MKRTNITKALALVLLLSLLAFSLTGCAELDYRKAVLLYNSGSFDAAAEQFSALGNYEDSSALSTRSQYLAAVKLMEKGKYSEALPRFVKLGAYEDSALRASECKYRIAVSLFDDAQYQDAEVLFLEISEYKQTGEYLRRIGWQKLFDRVLEAGAPELEQDGKLYTISADVETCTLSFCVSYTREQDYIFRDDLTVSLTRDSCAATFAAVSTFTMDFSGKEIGSTQESSGLLDIATCTPETVLNPNRFQMTVTDNLGNTTTTDDLAYSKMADTMQENLADLLTSLPAFLENAEIPVTLSDIGFAAL